MLLGARTGTWAKIGGGELPYDYEVDWISGGTIHTGVYPTATTTIDSYITLTDAGAWNYPYECPPNVNGKWFIPFAIDSGLEDCRVYIGGGNRGFTSSLNVKYHMVSEIVNGSTLVYRNDSLIADISGQADVGTEFVVHTEYGKNRAGITKLSTDGVLVFNGIPVVKDNGGYMYDRVSGVMIAKPDSSPFNWGYDS